MENLKETIKEILSYEKLFNIKFSPDMVLDCSTRIFISQNIQENKQNNIKEFKEAKKENVFEPVTPKQKFALKKIGYIGDLNKLSKQEAIKIIKENYEGKAEDY